MTAPFASKGEAICGTLKGHLRSWHGWLGISWLARGLFLILRCIVDAYFLQGFLALNARAALATMLFSTFIAAPSFGIVKAESFANACNLARPNVCIGRLNTHIYKCACIGGSVYCLNKLGTTVGIYRVVSTVIGNQNLFKLVAFCNANRD